MVYHIHLLGFVSTGKSQILNVYVYGNSFGVMNPTAAAACGDMHDLKGNALRVWDYNSLLAKNLYLPMTSFQTDFLILLYSIDSMRSFQYLEELLELAQKKCSNGCEIVLVGNKIDLEDEREVPRKEAEEFAHKHGLPHFEISAKTREECGAPFEYCAERFQAKKMEKVDPLIKKEKDSQYGGFILKQSIEFIKDMDYVSFQKGGNTFKLPLEKGVLSIGENKYKQWIDRSYPGPVELQDGRVDELVKYCNSDSIPHCIYDVQELHNEILYWNSSKVVQKSLNQCELDFYEDLFLIRRGEKYCVNREQVCRTSKLLCKYVFNAKGSSIVFLEIKGDEFSSVVFDIFVEFHRVSDYIIPFDIFDEFERFCVFYECDYILEHLSYHRIDSIIQCLLINDIEDLESFENSLSYKSIVSLLYKDCKYLFRHDCFFKLGINLHFLIFSNKGHHEIEPSSESKKNIDPSDFIFFLNSLLGYHGICCSNLLGYLVYNNTDSPQRFDFFKNNLLKSSILMNLFSSMKSHSEQIQEKNRQTKKRFLIF